MPTETNLFVPAFPTIRPESLLRRGTPGPWPPFDRPRLDFHFARNAIFHAARALHLERGVVLAPAYHHGVEIEALRAAGAGVRFYRIGPRFEVDIEDVERQFGPDTRALYLTHFLGFPGPVQEMADLARRHGVPLIEDCALALLSADGPRPLGLAGDVSVFCFYKVLAVPDGGCLTVGDHAARGGAVAALTQGGAPSLVAPSLSSTGSLTAASLLRNLALRGGRRGRQLRRQIVGLGRATLAASRVAPVLTGGEHFDPGHAQLGISGLSRWLIASQDLQAIIETRRRNYRLLHERLADLAPTMFDRLAPGVVPLCYPLLVDDNRRAAQVLAGHGIEAVDFWRQGHPACEQSAFPDVARYRRSLLEIPCHQDLTPETIDRMAEVIREFLPRQPRRQTTSTDPIPMGALSAPEVGAGWGVGSEPPVVSSIEGPLPPGLAHAWNQLASDIGDEPFYRHEYVAGVLRHFAPDTPVRLLLARDQQGHLDAVLPLVAGRSLVCGLPARHLSSPTNVHSFRFDLLARDPAAVAPALLARLREDESWDMVRLTDVPAGGAAWTLYDVARDAGLPVGIWEAQRSPFIALPDSEDELYARLTPRFRANLRRRRRRLQERGVVDVLRVTAAAAGERDACQDHLAACLEIERRGWKGRRGTAIASSRAAQGFYRHLLATPELRQQAAIWLLRLDGRPIACQVALASRGCYRLLMTSYDETLRECSPGHLLMEDVLRDAIARGLREVDFLGCDLRWKLDWTQSVRAHHWLFLFRDSRWGRALHTAKFGWAPALRARLSAGVPAGSEARS